MIGPPQLERDAVGAGPQAVVTMELRERLAEPHLLELVHRPWCEPVSARLLAGNVLRSTTTTSCPARASQ